MNRLLGFFLEMDDAALQSSHDSLSAIFHLQTHQNRADMGFDGCFRDAQVRGNPFVALAMGKELENLALSRAEIRIWHARCQSA